MAIMEAGKRKVKATKNTAIWEGTGSVAGLKVCISGTMMMTIGTMKIAINSRRRVKALKSFLISAASVVENPSLPKTPVLGAYIPRETVIAGGS